MAPLATRFVRISLDTKSVPGELKRFLSGAQFKAAGTAAGKEWASGFKAVAKAELAQTKFKIKVEADWSGFKNPPGVTVPKTTSPAAPKPQKVPVELDPLVGAFQTEVRKQLNALSREVSAKIPVNADTTDLRADIADKIRVVQNQLKVKVPAGADARRFETDLRALVKEAEAQIRINLPVEEKGAVEAGRRAARVANAAAGSIKLRTEGGGLLGRGGLGGNELSGLTSLASFASKATFGLGRLGEMVGGFVTNALKSASTIADLASKAFETFSGTITGVGKSAGGAASGLSSVAGSLSGVAGAAGAAVQLGWVLIALSALPALALAASGAIIALTGALGSLPALGVGLGATFGALALGFSGISDHLKTLPKASGGAAKSLTGLRSAQRAVTTAQRELTKATKELNQARRDEVERIDDLGRSLRGAMLDEEDAASAVAAARTKLAEARGSGDVNAIGEADRAYRRSLLTLDEARDKTGDLASEKAKADKDGVEGSDQVQRALDQQRDATERLQAANEALTEAQKSAGGAGAAAAAKLQKIAPAAQEVVNKLKQLKPVLEDIRLSVQQALFTGVGDELQRLSDSWKQPLKTTLTEYASTLNGLFKNLSSSVQKPQFISDITSAAGTFRENLEKIGKVVTGPLVEAFGHLAKSAKPFLDMLGDKIAGALQHFSDWINEAAGNGKLDRFFQDAADYASELWDIGKNLFGIFTDFFGIFVDSKNQGGAKDYLQGFNHQLETIRDWLQNPSNQKRIKEWIEKFGDFVKKAEDLATWITDKLIPGITNFLDWIDKLKKKYDEWKESWKKLKDDLLAPLNFFGLFDGLPSAFRSALVAIGELWSKFGLSFDFKSNGTTISGSARPLNIPAVPKVVSTTATGKPIGLATGGVVQPRPGGTLVRAAEAGEAEIYAPESKMQQLLVEAVRMVMGEVGGAGRGDITVLVQIGDDQLAPATVRVIERNPTVVARANRAGAKRLNYAT